MAIKRLYRTKDLDMHSEITGSMLFFEEHLAEFTAYDPSLDAAFLADWRTCFDSLLLYFPVKGSERPVFEDSFLIADADKVLEKCRAKYIDVKYYAGKAFPKNKGVKKEFGEGNYSKVQSSRLRMVQFMETLHGVALKYKTELIAQHYTQAAIDEIGALAQELRNENNGQQLKKKERPSETHKRIEAFNRFYGFGQRVAEAAATVYRDNEAYRNMLLLAKRHHPDMTKQWMVINAGAVRKITLKKLLKKYTVTLTNQSKETIDYWRANNIKEKPEQKQQLDAGEIISIEAEEPAKKFLVVQNTSSKAVRLMLVKEKKEKPEAG